MEYKFASCIGPTAPPHDFGVVAVIDGSFLKLTPLRLANIPPPMALHELALPGNATDVAVSVLDGMTLLAVLFEDRSPHLYEWNLPDDYQKKPSVRWVGEINRFRPVRGEAKCVNQMVTFDSSGKIWVLQSTFGHSNSTDSLSMMDLKNEHIQYSATAQDGQEADWTKIEDGPTIADVQSLKTISCIKREHQDTASKTVFDLSSTGRLSAVGVGIKDLEIVRNCTSYLVTPTHLIFTTTQHLLKFVHLEDMVVPGDTPEADERCRTIERGAKLVTVMPSIYALVLQMPRGNLETIYPRALVLPGIRKSLDEKRYRKAFLACRNHRVDMNILYDYHSEAFLDNVALFVAQVKKVEHIDLFLSQLRYFGSGCMRYVRLIENRNEDVSQTMYADTLPPHLRNTNRAVNKTPSAAQPDKAPSKVNQICDAFLDVLRKRKSTHIQNIISAHVCKMPPDLDSGLVEIANLREDNPEQAESATEHICFLADVNKLYENALGLYDLELTLLVAQQTQKDPREYLPFLQNLQDMPALRRQYAIDDYLSRHSKALKSLYDLDVFGEVEAYVVKHALYTQALELYRYRQQDLTAIVHLHADYLQQTNRYKEAGIAFESLKLYEAASESYRLAHLWRESLSCAAFIPASTSQLQTLARILCEDLIESKDFASAAVIQRDYLKDVPAAARLYCKGYQFSDALRIISADNRADLLESVIDAGLTEDMATITELLADCRSQLNAQVPRILELRQKKTEEPLAFFEGDPAGGADIPDNVSLAPTDASNMERSLFTRYTNRTGTVATNMTHQTAKRRQREERKRARGKKGSVYEEEYLINSVGRLVERVNSVTEEVERLVAGLLRRGMRERALAIEAAIVALIQLCKDSTGKVYPKEAVSTAEEKQKPAENGVRPSGGEGVLWDSMEESQIREPPPIKEFARLNLLSG